MRYSAVPENLHNLEIMLHNPHPGIGGAVMPLPEDIKRVIDEMTKIQEWGGPTFMSLGDAFDRLQATVGNRGKISLHLLPDELFQNNVYFKRGFFSLEITEEESIPPQDIVVKDKRFIAVPDSDGKYRNKHCWPLICFVENIKT